MQDTFKFGRGDLALAGWSPLSCQPLGVPGAPRFPTGLLVLILQHAAAGLAETGASLLLSSLVDTRLLPGGH